MEIPNGWLKVLFLSIILVIGGIVVFASDETQIQLISNAQRWELEQMASLRGLSVKGVSDELLRKRLLQFEGLPDTVEPQESGSGEKRKDSYTLKVLQAWHLEKNGENSLVTLLGSVSASFLLNNEPNERILSSNKMLIDVDNTLLSAMGGVTYRDASDKAAVQEMEGDVITLDWNNSSLSINEGMTRTKRKNSDDEEIEFFTTGGNITYDTKQGGIYFTDGYITNNRENAYSSITAQKLAMMDNGDMVMKNAYLSLGRIPILWVPYFLFPGSRMIGNPAIGQESERGWFVNTTFELYGSDPAITSSSTSSFTRLLETDDTETVKIKDGPTYRKLKDGEELSPVEKWAKESGSFMSILGDSYQNGGLSMGVVTQNNLWGKKLSIIADGRLAATADGSDSITTSSKYPKTRYMVEDTLKYTSEFANMTIQMPLYSDPKVKRTYANRFTSFSIDHLMGAEWPTDYTSDVTSYTWKANLSLSLPSAWKSKLLDTLSVSSAQASAAYSWLFKDSTYAYRLSSVTVPDVTATMGGTIFDFSGETKADEQKKKTEEQVDSTAQRDEYADAMLKDAYRANTASSAGLSEKRRFAKLTYSLSEKLNQTAKSVSNTFNWDATHYLYSLLKGNMVLDTVADPLFFTLKETISPSYTYTEDMTKDTWKTRDFNIISATVASVPLLGLTYSLTEKMYSYTESTTTSAVTSVDENAFKFTTSYVTTHQLVLSKTIPTARGTFTPSMTYILPPLTQSLTPAFVYKIGKFTFTDSFKFVQDDDGILKHNLITSIVAFDGSVLDFTFKGTYQSDEYTASDPWGPFDSTGSVSLSKWGVTLGGSYDYTTRSTNGDYYFNALSSIVGYGPLKSTFTFIGPYDNLIKSTWVNSVNITNYTLRWWKNRCTLKLNLSSSLSINFINKFATTFSITAGLQFSIAEFLDVKFSVTSGNNGFFTYYDNGEFSWNLMLADLARSFDLFGGGVRRTQFNMSKLSLELVHYMDDWTLNCKYTGSVVLSNNKYSWVPVVAVYLQWKTIPELKVDQNWTKKSGSTVWSATSSSST